jgi:hypothetical protein
MEMSFRHLISISRNYDKIIFDNLPKTLADNQRSKADLFDLVQQFKENSKPCHRILKGPKKIDPGLFHEQTSFFT